MPFDASQCISQGSASQPNGCDEGINTSGVLKPVLMGLTARRISHDPTAGTFGASEKPGLSAKLAGRVVIELGGVGVP